MVDLTVVIPYYNGFNHLNPLFNELVPQLEKLRLNWEILIIDDHSSDKGYEFLEEQNRLDSRIRCIRLRENRGQQNAVFCGLVHARGALIITMDDDLQHPPEIIGDLVRKIKEGYDIVYAVNRSDDRNILLRWGTGLNGLFFSLFLHKPFSVAIGSYRIMTRELIDRFRDVTTGFVYISALVFTGKPAPEACSFTYTPVIGTGEVISRFNLKSRTQLFFRLLKNYGPVSFLTKEKGEPFLIEKNI